MFEKLLGPDHHRTVDQSIYIALTKLDEGFESVGMELFRLAQSRFSNKKITIL
jgi:hypothetical protein